MPQCFEAGCAHAHLDDRARLLAGWILTGSSEATNPGAAMLWALDLVTGSGARQDLARRRQDEERIDKVAADWEVERKKNKRHEDAEAAREAAIERRVRAELEC